MKKHFIILALVLCLALIALAACDRNQNDPSTESDTTPETWLCACGVGSGGKFCPECGEAKPEPETTDGETDTASEPDSEAATDGETETDTAAETKPAETKPAETEAVTHAPRYDYFDADVKADVTLDQADYTNMQLTLPADLEITHEAVMDYIENILFQYRTADNGTTQVTDQPMKWGDDAYIYYKGMIDGVAFEGGSNWDDTSPYTLGLGSGAFIPGFEEGLVGVIPKNATKDSPAEVHVTFPENYNPELAGKDAVFYVAVVYAVQYTLPEYNRATVENTLKYEGKKDFYASDAAYLSEFEDYVREYLESSIAEDVEYEKMNALWSYLTGKAVCVNLPQTELDYYHNAYLDEIEYYYDYYKSYGGSAFAEQYPDLDSFAKSYMGVEADADWKAELNKLCEDMVKKDMITHAIAELEGFETITDEEFNAEIQYWVDYYQGYMTKDEILTNMGETVIREGALSEKVQKWLFERVTFTYADAE